jgi:HTH-type transcriptional regulator/antitoxin HigA
VTIKPIRNTDDLKAAKARIAALLRTPNIGQLDDEIEVLATLIERFEQRHSPIDAPTAISAIRYRMAERGLSPRQLEPFIGSRARVSEVLSGKRQLSIDMIRSLHEGLDIPYAVLISDRTQNADVNHVSPSALARLNSLGFPIDRSSISTFVASMHHSAPNALLRKTRTQRAASKTDQGALYLWQAAVLRKAEELPPATPFSPETFGRLQVRHIAKMSSKNDGPSRAIQSLATVGIAVVIMPSLPGTFLDGALMVSATGAPVVGLTLRHDRVDSFWFTLLHELSHAALHFADLLETQHPFVDDMEIHSGDEQEREADALARDSLVPPKILKHAHWGPATTHEDLHTIAIRSRVHLSAVVGRWQWDHQNYKKFSRLVDRGSIRSLLSL